MLQFRETTLPFEKILYTPLKDNKSVILASTIVLQSIFVINRSRSIYIPQSHKVVIVGQDPSRLPHHHRAEYTVAPEDIRHAVKMGM